jgi:hypothetical protein
MNKLLLIGGASILVLTACATGPQIIYTREKPRLTGYTPFVGPPNPTAPNVFIVAGEIVVDQEPIRPPGNQQGDPITIYWGLQDSSKNYFFPNNAIEIQGHPAFCSSGSVSDDVFKCQYNRPAPGTPYKYKIRVKQRQGPPIHELDPTIMN